jgi:hypothetical protein
MEGRIGKLESDVEYIKRDVSDLRGEFRQLRDVEVRELRSHQERDFRLLFGVIVFVALGIGGMLAKLFGWFH